MSSDDSIAVGRLVFTFVRTVPVKRGKREFQLPVYRCPLCPRGNEPLYAKSIPRHLEAHDRRAEKSRSTRNARELGMTPPLPGQLGFDVLGVAVVPPKPAPRVRAERKAAS